MRIFAVDDEKSPLKIIEMCIRASAPGSDLHLYGSAATALAEFREYPADVVFLDINMPGMTGLELAKKMSEIKSDVNIIFCTGYGEYALDAFNLYASGYLTKPAEIEDVGNALSHLRFPVTKSAKTVRIKTFGSFDVFADGKVVPFRRSRSKEVLAYLVDRGGSSVTRKEIAAVVFDEDDYSRSTQAYLSMILKALADSLEDAGIGDLLVVNRNSYAVDTAKFTCDSYEFLAGDPAAKKLFTGEYMFQYSWAEEETGKFYDFG